MAINGGRDASVSYQPTIFFGVCIDSNDPLRIGRIIATDDVTTEAEHGQETNPVQELDLYGIYLCGNFHHLIC